MRILRVLKGIATSAVLWGVAWVPLTMLLTGVTAAFGMPLPDPGLWGILLLRQGIAGTINGAVFGTALAVLGRHRPFESLSYGLFAACGAIGGAVLPAILTGIFLATFAGPLPLGGLIFGIAMNGFIGAVCAAESLRLARKAPALPNGREGAGYVHGFLR